MNTTEAPENIGTAFKTIIARMAQIKEMGSVIDEDGIVTSLNKVDTALKSVGVNLTDQEGMIRDLQDVFGELGEVWDGLDRNSKAYIATQLAGSRQQSRFLAMMNDWNRTLELISISQTSAGEASRQFQTHLTGLGASMTRLTAAKEQFMMKMLDSEAYKGVIDSARNLLSLFTGMHPALMALIGATTIYTSKLLIQAAAHTAVAAAKKAGDATSVATEVSKNVQAFREVNKGLYDATENTKALTKGTGALGGVLGRAGEGVTKFAGGLKAAWSAAWPYLAVLAAIYLAYYLIAQAATKAKRAVEDMQEQMSKKAEEATVLERQKDQIKSLVDEQQSLMNQLTRTKQEEERLKSINEELIISFGHLGYTIDHLGNVQFNDLEGHVKGITEEIKELRLESLELERTLSKGKFLLDVETENKENINKASGLISTPMIQAQASRGAGISQEDINTFIADMEVLTEEGKKTLEKLKREFFSNIAPREAEIKAITEDYGTVGLAIVSKLTQGIVDGFSDDIVEATTIAELEAVADNIQIAIDEALSDFKFVVKGQVVDETDFTKYLQEQNKYIKSLIAEESDINTIRNVINDISDDFVKMGMKGTDAFSFLSDLQVQEFAMGLEHMRVKLAEIEGVSLSEADNILEMFTSQGILYFNLLTNAIDENTLALEKQADLEGLTDSDKIDFVNTGLEKQIQLYQGLTLAMSANQTVVDEAMSKAESLYDTGNLALYNLEIRQLAEDLPLTTEQQRLFNEMLLQMTPPVDMLEYLDLQEQFKDNYTTLLELEKGIAENKIQTAEQIKQIIALYGMENVALEMRNGLWQISADSVKNLMTIEEAAHEMSMLNAKASIEAQIVKLKAEAYVLDQWVGMAKTRAEVEAEVTNIMNSLSADHIHEIAHNTVQGEEFFATMSESIAINSENSFAAAIDNVKTYGINSGTVIGLLAAAWSALFKGIATESQNIDPPKVDPPTLKGDSAADFRRWDREMTEYSQATWNAQGGDYTYKERESRLETIRKQIANLESWLQNIDSFDLSQLTNTLKDLASGSGGAAEKAKDLEKAIKDTDKAMKDAAEKIEEYVSKLDMWYNAIRQILTIEQELAKVRKERELTLDNSKINASIEEEIVMMRQLEAQQRQLNELQSQERNTIAVALQIAAGAAVTLSDDLKHLHVNQEAYQALSMGQKAIVDELIDSFDNLSKSIHSTEMAALDAQVSIRQMQLALADQYIAAIQAGLKKQQKLLIAAIDYELKAIQEAHKAKMDMYQEELDAILGIIDAKLKSIDEEAAEEDWQEQLKSAMDEELQLRNRINQLALDDSFEAQSKRAELEEELQSKLQQIEKMQRDRRRALRRTELQNLQEHYKKEFDQSRRAADEQVRILTEQLEQSKTKINYYYQEIYNDEVKWAQMREDILKGNFDSVNAEVANLTNFFDDIGKGIVDLAKGFGVDLLHTQDLFSEGVDSAMMKLGASWNATTNLVNEISRAQERAISITQGLTTTIAAMTAEVLRHTAAVKAAQSAAGMSGGSGGTQPPGTQPPGTSPPGTGTPDHGHMSPAWKHGYDSGKKAAQIEASGGQRVSWQRLDLARASGYLPGGYRHGPNTSSDWYLGFDKGVADAQRSQQEQVAPKTTIPSTPTVPGPVAGGDTWWKLFHDGGIASGSRNQYHGAYSKIAGGKNNKLSKLINDMFQTQNDEVVAKLLQGEVVVNPVASIDNLRSNLQSFMDNVQPTAMPIASGQNVTHEVINIDINHMVADNKQHVQDVFEAIKRGKRRIGSR